MVQIPGRDETPAQRADRNFADLLQEVRVTQTGVSILFSLLLTVPFTSRWEQVTLFQRQVYVVALLLAAAALVVLISPVAQHRLLFARGLKPTLVSLTAAAAAAGLSLLLLSVSAVLLLVMDVLYSTLVACAVAVVFGLGTVVLWVVPAVLLRRR